ncbi:uncharacterized protein LOC114880379 [Osmia bicornis bicornis]|uniref:uncharacterized protein LOC114880379 n=1 Tax=Osmia bicornis bicornis TaxID=1437191 RepID=UPI0010F5D30D|nr:uncharacterized protein LOC114880379 [Osmia bicornis bicornis]
MNGMRSIFCYFCFVIILESVVHAEESNDLNENLRLDISRGVTLHVANNTTSIVIRMSTLLKKNDIEQRNVGRLGFKNGILKRIGMTMMMIPMIIQLITLPAALASIKMSLLRSLLVGKIALIVILFNALRNSQKSEVVLVHRPEYHEHYYNSYHQPEDDDEGWVGR